MLTTPCCVRGLFTGRKSMSLALTVGPDVDWNLKMPALRRVFPLRRPVISDKQYHDALVVTLKYIGHVMIITLVQSATCTLVNPKIAHAIPQVMEMVIDGSFQGVSYINVMYNSCSSASITRKASRLKSTGNLTLQTAKCGALKARSTPCCWQHSTL